MTGAPASGRPSGRSLFIAAVLLQALVSMLLIADSRMVRGGATLAFYEARQRTWMGADGPPAGPGGLLLTALQPFSTPMRSIPFLPLFQASMFVDELVFLVGVWLLSKRFFRNPVTTFFVTVAAAGSTLWTDHVQANLFAFHAVPLVLHGVLEFVDTGARRSLFLAALLLFLQGTLSSILAVLLCLGSAAAMNPARLAAFRGAGGRGRADLLWLLAVAAVSGFAFVSAPPPPVPASPPGAWLDLLIGASLSPNATVFCGFFTVGFAYHAVVRGEPRRMLRAAALGAASIAVLGIAGTPYPFVRLFVVALGGVGLERFLEDRRGGAATAARMLVLALVLGVLTGASLVDPPTFEDVAGRLLGAPPGRTEAVFPRDARDLPELFGFAAMGAGAAAAVLGLLGAGGRARPLALALLLLLHPIDVYSWKSRNQWYRTRSVAEEPRTPVTGDGASHAGPAFRRAVSFAAAAGAAGVLVLLAAAILRELGLRRRPEELP